MKGSLAVVPPTLRLLQQLAGSLGKRDLDECIAAGHTDALGALQACVRAPGESHVALTPDGAPQAIFGCTVSGRIWMLGTELVATKYVRVFLKESKRVLAAFQLEHETLHGLIDQRNTTHQRWLKKLGFLISEKPFATGPAGHPFLYFVR